MNSNPRATSDTPAQPRVLLVDDDEVNLLLTSIALRERGFLVIEAGSGQQALDIILQAKGLLMKKCKVVDATLIAAPSSTKNASMQSRDWCTASWAGRPT